jgi:ATP-dependent Clp protease ATP-binding subunit ClpB
MFLPLSKAQIRDVVKLQIDGINRLLKDSDVNLQVTDKAIDFIADAGFDPEFGARPVKRVLQRYLLNELSKELIAQRVDKSKPVIVDTDGEKLTFKN